MPRCKRSSVACKRSSLGSLLGGVIDRYMPTWKALKGNTTARERLIQESIKLLTSLPEFTDFAALGAAKQEEVVRMRLHNALCKSNAAEAAQA